MRSRSCYRREKPREGEEGGKREREMRDARGAPTYDTGITTGEKRRVGGCGERCRTDRVTVWVNHTPPLVHKYALIALFSPRADTRVRLSPTLVSPFLPLSLPRLFALLCYEIKYESTREERPTGSKGRRTGEGAETIRAKKGRRKLEEEGEGELLEPCRRINRR